MSNTGSLFVICAPSGAGKTSLIKALLATDDQLQVSISHTTRAERSGEENGKDYFFISDSEFITMRDNADFLESATVYGHSYGTSKREVNRLLDSGLDLILEIDWQGAQQVRAVMSEAIVIGILPPSIEALEQRLHRRGKDSEQVIQQRMDKAREEITQQKSQNIDDYLVVNTTFDRALEQLRTIIAAGRLRTSVNSHAYRGLVND